MEELKITLVNKVSKNKKIEVFSNTILTISIILLGVIFVIDFPSKYDRSAFDFIKENYWVVIGLIFSTIFSLTLKKHNKKLNFGSVTFNKNEISTKWNNKKSVTLLEDIQYIEYWFITNPEDSGDHFESVKHWIKIIAKNNELYTEFLGENVQGKLIAFLLWYKQKGLNVKVDMT